MRFLLFLLISNSKGCFQHQIIDYGRCLLWRANGGLCRQHAAPSPHARQWVCLMKFIRYASRLSQILQRNFRFLQRKQNFCKSDLVIVLLFSAVGQAAFNKRHRWMFSDAHFGGQIPLGSIENQDLFQVINNVFMKTCWSINPFAVMKMTYPCLGRT